jgi:hypothetical protein
MNFIQVLRLFSLCVGEMLSLLKAIESRTAEANSIKR